VTWLNPAAAFAIVLAAAPVLIHLLVHRHAEQIPFPTLRFLRPTRLAAIRRHVLEDILLLAVRVVIVAAATAAVAAPLVIGAARRAEWNARIARAIVIPDTTGGQPSAARESAFRVRQFRTATIADGVHRAVAWLADSPPARRELVIAGPLVVGSILETDLAAIPGDIGIRFERIGALPPERTVDAAPVLTIGGTERRFVTLDGTASLVRTAADSAQEPRPIEVAAPPAARAAIDAAVQAVLSERVRKPPADRRARLILIGSTPGDASADLHADEIRTAWMADAIARIARDVEVQDEAGRQTTAIADPRLTTPPWYPIAVGADGRAVVSGAASGGALVVVSAAAADQLITPLLLRSIANGMAPDEDSTAFEIVPIAENVLRAWTRAPGAVIGPRIDTVERDDRRWLWIAVLALLGVETILRHGRRQDIGIVREESRVA
jgi:hypothetical protein